MRRERNHRESSARAPSLEIVLPASLCDPGSDVAAELPALRGFAGYELLGRIAVGGMAEVFVARERSVGGGTRHVALKVVRAQLANEASFEAMFVREGKVALGLRHPNVCHTYRVGIEGGHPFLAMELVSGITLRDLSVRTRRKGMTIPVPIAIKIASAVAEALHSAHVACDERGRPLEVVHQDVSPHNVMIAYDGTVKLLDFGVAQSSHETRENGETSGAETSHTTLRGKLAYLSPEQCIGAPVDARTDVFSLGTVLHELLTGERLWKRDQRLETLRAIAEEPLDPASLEGLPPPLVRVLQRAMQKAPSSRYESAAQMQDDLERCLVHQRVAVTSARIATFLREVLDDDFGRPAPIDTGLAAVSWLRGDATAAPFLLVSPRMVAPPATAAPEPRAPAKSAVIPRSSRHGSRLMPRLALGVLVLLASIAVELAVVPGTLDLRVETAMP